MQEARKVKEQHVGLKGLEMGRGLIVPLNVEILHTSVIDHSVYIHCESKRKLDHFLFEHNFRKYCPIFIAR